MNLVIVESPTKAKTISKFLGKGYNLESSFGHVRDLPKSVFGVDVENGFQPKYIVPVKSKKTISHLKTALAKADKVILATDEDREGEAIAWHLAEALKLNPNKTERIVFHEITKPAIEEALGHPRAIDMRLVDAQQARRVLDRIVGYKLSPFLWKKVARGLSAGRVQSVALRLIVEREKEIRAFKPEEYWTIMAELKSQSNQNLIANLDKIDGKKLDKLDIKTKEEADKIVSDLEISNYQVGQIIRKETKRNPLPPFTTSTLQQAAANRLGFSAKKTMFVAQRLYENGHITYMRTDSVNLSQQSMAAAKKWLSENIGKKYVSDAPRIFKTKSKSAQEAHEAIRPTDVFKRPEDFKTTPEEERLYKLIWQRFVASQMPQAKIATVAVEILAEVKKLKTKNYGLRATGQQIIFDGFLKVWPQKFEEKELPDLEENDGLELIELKPDQHFTEPPPRYTEATLVKTLEEHGIGRPSTYAPIISVIQDRKYAEKEKGKFTPTPLGEVVNKVLTEHFPEIVDVNFTAKMENDLDEIAAGEQKWQKPLEEFYEPFIKNLEAKYVEVGFQKIERPAPEKTDQVCEKCGKPMVIRSGRYGKFIACSGFPECKNTKPLTSPETGSSPDSEKKSFGKCPKCGEGELIRKFARKTRRGFWGCSAYPKCDYATWENPQLNS